MPKLRNILASRRAGLSGFGMGGRDAGDKRTMKDRINQQMDKTKMGRNLREAGRTERGRNVLMAGAEMVNDIGATKMQDDPLHGAHARVGEILP